MKNFLFGQNGLAAKIVHTRYLSRWIVMGCDVLISTGVTVFAYWFVRFVREEPVSWSVVGWLAIFAAIISALSFAVLHSHRMVMRFTTLRETWRLGIAMLLKVVILYPLVHVIYPEISGWRLILGGILDMMTTTVALVSVRVLLVTMYDFLKVRVNGGQKRVLIYGMDDCSASLSNAVSNSFLPSYKVAGYLTIGKRYKHYRLSGENVYFVTGEEAFSRLVKRLRIEGIVFPNYRTAQEEQKRLVNYCQKLGMEMLGLPSVVEVNDGQLPRPQMKEIRLEELLWRDEIKISMKEIGEGLDGKVVMVTGAAGSIGSELCRQLTRFNIKQLIFFDSAETPMHNIQLEFTDKFPNTRFVPVIGDVRSKERVDFVFRNYRPQVVFHAAAYKHVPLMELNPCEAVRVNVYGTMNVADHAVRYGVEQFVMVSTDKAVNPTNVMGASKRLAEIYVQSLSVAIRDGEHEGITRFITTRFGNVLGSNGSVIPRFREQIRNGGPVTVTHPDIIRYFMTIPEACRLVMEAGIMGKGGEIYIFEMGRPVKIADMARKMIELSGFNPDKDISIIYTGLRPGEKLYEELLSNKENTLPTAHDKIRVAKVREYNYKEVAKELDVLNELAALVNIPEMVKMMKDIVPEFVSKNSEFEKFDKPLLTPPV